MYTELTSFLIELGEDPSMQRSFRADPSRVMADYGLNEREAAVMGSRNSSELRRFMESAGDEEFGTGLPATVMVYVQHTIATPAV